MNGKEATFRFYGELNDFFPVKMRQQSLPFAFRTPTSAKNAIESFGVPHTEIDMVLVNGEPSYLSSRLSNGDRVSVYPVFESIDISSVLPRRQKSLRKIRFILDVHLGKLASLLRIFGFDTLYRNDYDDPEIIETALKEKRIILTRDIGILKNKLVTHGYYIRSDVPRKQLDEVIRRFDLYKLMRPFTICPVCNGTLKMVSKAEVYEYLDLETRRYYDDFCRCSKCEKIYWEGSHYQKMRKMVEKMKLAGPLR